MLEQVKSPYRSVDLFKIDKGVPIPSTNNSRLSPFTATTIKMDVDDSFQCALKFRSFSYQAFKHPDNKGKKFAVRKLDANTMRVWRTE